MGQREELKECFKVFEQIEQTSSRNEKIAILSKNGTDLLKQVLFYTFNKALVFGMGEKSIGKFKPNEVAPVKKRTLFALSNNEGDLFSLLDRLSSFELSGNNAISEVRKYVNQDDEFFYKWASKIFLKDLKMGMSAKTINEVFPNWIPVFNVQKGEVWDWEPITRPCKVQRKMNGYRVIILNPTRGDVELYSSNGVLLPGFNFIKEQVRNFLPAGFAYDGELANNRDNFSRAQELIFSEQDVDKTEMKFYNWDWMTIEEWENEKSASGYFFRHDTLRRIHAKFTSPNLEFLENIFEWDGNVEVDVTEEILNLFENAKQDGWEGLMVKYDIPYVWDRTPDMIKIKEVKEIDLVVTEVFEGKGNFKGVLGGVYVDYKGSKQGVGSGFKMYDKDPQTGERIPGERIKFWENPNLIIDKVIKIHYFTETQDKNGKPSLQFARYKGIHPEKNDQLF